MLKRLQFLAYTTIVVFSFLIVKNKVEEKLTEDFQADLKSSELISGRKSQNFNEKLFSHPSAQFKDVLIRAGYFQELAPFKACVQYLPGFGDSILNHEEYFRNLNQAGFRVIAFDYMGQGGSSGLLSNMRVKDAKDPEKEIAWLADYVWKEVGGLECQKSKRFVIGWSVGGLVAYHMAMEKKVDATILISPGIALKGFLSETSLERKNLLTLNSDLSKNHGNRQIAQERSYRMALRPDNPFVVLGFTLNWIQTTWQKSITQDKNKQWQVPSEVKGLVFISGSDDPLIDIDQVQKRIKTHAPHFEFADFSGKKTSHDLDNSIPEISNQVFKLSIDFLNQAVAKN